MNWKQIFVASFIILLWGCANDTKLSRASSAGPLARIQAGVPATQLAGCRRIVFLGDSITYSGQYVDDVELVLRRSSPKSEFEFLDLGLPSETVSGLSEPGHAGGAFPRPTLHERLERLLEQTRPNLVIACYGMNDGIYYPFADERFQAFQDGSRLLHERVVKSGARIIHVTPPVFDPVPIRGHTLPAGLPAYPQPYEGYDTVLERYSAWLVGQRKKGWAVIDVHSPMKRELEQQRQKNPAFQFAADGVHLNDAGHWLFARVLLNGLAPGISSATFSDMPSPSDQEMLRLLHARNRTLSDAWLTSIGHKRPGMEKGLPLPEATAKVQVLKHEIEVLSNRTR